MTSENLSEIICQTMNIDKDMLSSRSSETHLVYARMIFSYYLFLSTANKHLIAEKLNKSVSSVRYYLGKYDEEIGYNQVFIGINERVKNQLEVKEL